MSRKSSFVTLLRHALWDTWVNRFGSCFNICGVSYEQNESISIFNTNKIIIGNEVVREDEEAGMLYYLDQLVLLNYIESSVMHFLPS